MSGEVLSVSVDPDGEGKRGCAVARLSGRFDGAGAVVFDGAVLSLLSASPPERGEGSARGVVLDLAGVSYLSSAGIRSLVRAGQTAKAAGAPFVLASLTPFVAQVLDLSGLLGVLRVFPSVAEGILAAGPRDGGELSRKESVAGGRRYDVTRLQGGEAHFETWGAAGMESLESPSVADLGIALGVGGLGASRAEASPSLGPFLSTGRLVALAVAGGGGEPDYLLSARPADSTFHVASATGIAGSPGLLVELPGGRVTAGELAAEMAILAVLTGLAGSSKNVEGAQPEASIGFVLVSGTQGVLGSVPESAEALRSGTSSRRELPAARGVVAVGLAGPDFLAHAVALTQPPPDPGPEGVAEALSAALPLDHLSDVVVLDPATVLLSPRGWVFAPRAVRAGAEKMTAIELDGGEPLCDEWLTIARRIYADASRVRLRRLAGGYSSVAFQAESWDREGRRTIPTVLKIASHSFTDREELAYHDCVKNFILNNATVIMGRAAEGSWSGLRYNFLGVGGAVSRLEWIGDRYAQRPFDEVEPLLETLFSRILDPWYGQSREEEVSLREEHDPAGLFPRLSEDAAGALGVDPDAPTVDCPEVGAVLPNPYRFLRETPPGGPRERVRWPVCITHGDLNPNNVLLDEKDNIYVIDFSETRPRNAVSDFARLEALAALQTTRIDDGRDAARVCRFFEGLVSVGSLGEAPRLVTDGEDPAVEKAWAFVSLLRRHAARVVSPRTAFVPYLWPLLQWTVPIVSFGQVSPLLKRVSMVASALVVRRILAGERT